MRYYWWSFICLNKRGKGAALCTEKDIGFIIFQDLSSFHHNHQICIHDGVNSMLQSLKMHTGTETDLCGSCESWIYHGFCQMFEACHEINTAGYSLLWSPLFCQQRQSLQPSVEYSPVDWDGILKMCFTREWTFIKCFVKFTYLKCTYFEFNELHT